MVDRQNPIGDRPWRRFLPPAIFLALVIGAWLWRTPDPRIESTFRGNTMGTSYTVKLITAEALTADENVKVGRLIKQTLEAVNASMSTYQTDSELSEFNGNPTTQPVKASAELIALIRDAAVISAASGGAFDVTVGPLVNAWGFGPGGRGEAPSAAALVELRARIGYEKLTLGEGTLTKAHPQMYVDLSAIAKGHGVDRVFAGLMQQGYGDLMVEIGGETRARGRNAANRNWKVGIERPVAGDRAVHRIINLNNTSMATSGDYRNFYERDGRRISHTIDARTGEPITHRLASVTVVNARCALADGWATALNVLGPEEGLALATQKGLAAYFIVREPDGTWTETQTPAFGAVAGKIPPR